MFGIIQKKGDSNRLCGKLICYVRVLKVESNEGENMPFNSLVSPDGILAVRCDYTKSMDISSLGANFQKSLPKGLQNIFKQILEDEDMKEDYDKSKIKIDISSSKASEFVGNFFPIPTQIVPFESEEALLNEKGDIYFLGELSYIQNAHLLLIGFPIIYQSKYKEQLEREKEKEVDEMLYEIDEKKTEVEELEKKLCLNGELSNYKGNLLELLSKQVIPKIMLIIEEGDEENFKASMSIFRNFMSSYPHLQDIERMILTFQNINEKKRSGKNDAKILDLLCKKISALHHEEFEKLPFIQKELDNL